MSAAAEPASVLDAFQWERQPDAEAWVRATLRHVTAAIPEASALADRLLAEAGVRLIDLIDFIFLGDDATRLDLALRAGWARDGESAGFEIYRNPLGLFPAIAVNRRDPASLVSVDLKVESIADFLAANTLHRPIINDPGQVWRYAEVWTAPGVAAVGVVERHGWNKLCEGRTYDLAKAALHLERFRTRQRHFDDDADGFTHASALVDAAIADLGRDHACHLFFAAERDYWQRRNRAGHAQKLRQDRLGIGWANHDHHTYRSSREHFAALVALWEKLGFHCRERFYAGREAGWGAQVMEQPVTGIITFNDVDLTPEELMGDFSHDGLAPRDSLGTVGLWCGLHGEAFLQAGMHHLEAQFSFEHLRAQLEKDAGIKTMKPFTDFPFLRQAFTEGERWPVVSARIDRLLARNLITAPQAATFAREGALGSHLENLERNEGFKGFNQHGVSEIIAATDPRKQTLAAAH